MDTNFSTFEILPDEIFITIFNYLNASDICQSFYNLNNRFNILIHSLNNLHLTISENDSSNDITYIFPFIYSLTTISHIDLDLRLFKNLRRIILHKPNDTLLKQLDNDNLPYLESLSIPDVLFGMSPLHQKIFSNRFSNIKFCNLFGCETIETILKWTQTSSLRILKIGYIDFHVYKAILSACPNLYYLKLKMFQSYLKLSDSQYHMNLRKLEISSEINDWHYNDQLIDNFLGCVPNLEQLSIDRSISISKVCDLIPDYDWLASIIAVRLPFLQDFIFCLYLEYYLEFIEFMNTETHHQLRRLFFNAHKNRYQSRFIIT